MNFNLSTVRKIISFGQRAYREYQKVQKLQKPTSGQESRPAGYTSPENVPTHGTAASRLSAPYPGDYSGTVHAAYSPQPDGQPGSGEVVWTWVPYQEDYSQGKDRPVLIIGRDNQYLLALMLTSKDNTNVLDRDPRYLDIGTGSWDSKGRASEVKLDRVLRVLPQDVRREGSVIAENLFNKIIYALNQQ
ncbi:type II toxin-antitoxin system PemK/MazF family toxin [Rothia terrae]|uniref:Type II toxin-antitoxin system PemK/MazF family toxin n=1 Tax=Rothia terrae TaxID=396015 RepID=A0A7H2BB25_9MICC|nr:type II toxin-antitoxin system PemK/MazF family toxin [Rothia terrae]QNV36871.1 type II toxin-antitoxin system PemK/MazF family toxin [Rothia terrae]